MSKQSICAFAPATIANLNVGFDILGMALSTVGDKVEVMFNSSSENRILEIIDGPGIPTDTSKNCCSVVIQKMQEKPQENRHVLCVLLLIGRRIPPMRTGIEVANL